jgi:excisionase family DNA binding protein
MAEPAEARALTVIEVARALSVHRSTVYELCNRGELAHLRVSNAIRVRGEDLAAFLATVAVRNGSSILTGPGDVSGSEP